MPVTWNAIAEYEGVERGTTQVPLASPFPGSMKRLAPLFAAALLAGCHRVTDSPNTFCAAIATPGITVSVIDSITALGGGFTGLWVRARDGTYVDSNSFVLPNFDSNVQRISVAYNRAGTYTVTVHAAGYNDWVKTGVTVVGEVCFVTTIPLTARMVK